MKKFFLINSLLLTVILTLLVNVQLKAQTPCLACNTSLSGTSAPGINANAFGDGNTANGEASTVFGYDNVADGEYSTILGIHNFSGSNARFSIVGGEFSNASQKLSLMYGYNVWGNKSGGFAFGASLGSFAKNSYIFGTGPANSEPNGNNLLVNDRLNSFLIGYNGNPAFFVQGETVPTGFADYDDEENPYPAISSPRVGIGTMDPTEALDIANGGIRLGSAINSNAGTIQWNGSDFLGRTNSGWISLTTDSRWINNGTNIYFNTVNSKVGIGTNAPVYLLDVRANQNSIAVNTVGGVKVQAVTAATITRSGWSGAAKFGIGGAFGHSRGLRFVVDYDSTFTNEKDVLYLEQTGNVSIGITDPAGASLRLHKASTPKFDITNSNSSFQIGIASSDSELESQASSGDVVFHKSSGKGMLFYAPVQTDTNKTYIKFGDASNGPWVGIMNDKTMRIDGYLYAKEIRVKANVWMDKVLKSDYSLMPLSEVENFIKSNSHLPDVPSEKVVLESGIDVANMDAILLRKIEELTLYIIQQQKEIDLLKEKTNK